MEKPAAMRAFSLLLALPELAAKWGSRFRGNDGIT
jgi:hypothetical protein